MQLISHRCNSINSILNIHSTSWIEFDVSLSTLGNVVVCHDQEDRNNPSNPLFKDFIDDPSIGPKTFMVDIKAYGIVEAESLARKVLHFIANSRSSHTWYIGSFNEYCVIELASNKYIVHHPIKIGVISAGIPLGVFNHLNIDYAVLHYSSLSQDIVSRLHKNNIELYAYTVNSSYAKNLVRSLSIDGSIEDVN